MARLIAIFCFSILLALAADPVVKPAISDAHFRVYRADGTVADIETMLVAANAPRRYVNRVSRMRH